MFKSKNKKFNDGKILKMCNNEVIEDSLLVEKNTNHFWQTWISSCIIEQLFIQNQNAIIRK